MANSLTSVISGIGGSIKDLFANRDKVIRSKTDKPRSRDIAPQYPYAEPIEKRVLWLLEYYYREGSFEKIQFARKWMRNALIFQGYHELEWSEINVAWDVLQQDSGDFAFPNNYYRTLVLHGVRAYLQNEPIIEPVPSNDDAEAQAASKAARNALEIIRKSVKYDYLRVIEAINLRLFGNSFRYSYYSKDPRFGYATAPVYQDAEIVLSPGASICAHCGMLEGEFDQCPACTNPILEKIPAAVARVPQVAGSVRFPRGEVMTEVVNPLEVYVRSSSYDLWHAPFIIRNRVVDRLALQSTAPNVQLAPSGDEGGGEAYATGGDLGLIYLQSLADLPGDPTQYAAWYERATAAAKALLIEGWIRPAQYFFDQELAKKFPDGLYGAKTGDTLLWSRNETIEDHWTHYVFTPVPGRIWGDGDDDIIPEQLKLDETDRLIQRNQGYNSAPLLAIDSQRVDKNEILNDPSTIIEVKPAGRPVAEAVHQMQAMPLSSETWAWRNAHVSDMQFHARMSPTAMGRHEKGNNTFGGQESAAARSDSALLPNLILWKSADEQWARQVLKLAAENWIDERVHAVMGINGNWEFQKLRGAALDTDKFTILTRVLPIDPSQQDSMSKAVASGALDPHDPRVRRKMMELFHLPLELDAFYDDAKVQWAEIEEMKQSGQQIQPVLIRDNDQVHIEICRAYMNSDECRKNPQLTQLVLRHAQMHVMNMAKAQMMQAAVMASAQQVPGPGGQSGPSGQGGPPAGAPPPQPARRGPGTPAAVPQGPGGQSGQGGQSRAARSAAQMSVSPAIRQQRAMKGQAAKPHRPQPPEGNQWHRIRMK
jgi:hypothetical protein